MSWSVGVARRLITPPWGVELAGLGYYLHRTWERIRDDLTATAMVVTDDDGQSVAIVAADLMYNSSDFTHSVREQVASFTDIPPQAVCINFSHSHNSPTAGFIRGGGEADPGYLRFAARQLATAVILAWRGRKPARVYAGWAELAGITHNRTRENGPVDTRVSVIRADEKEGRPLAVAVNFHAHPVVHVEVDPRAVSRDFPGEVVDRLEADLPGVKAMYLQGTCGDVNVRPEFNAAHRRHEPARAVAEAALQALAQARSVEPSGVKAVTPIVSLPTRRWTREEVMREREEGLRRLETGDTTGWVEGVGRAVVNEPARLPERYGGSIERTVEALSRLAVEWTGEILPELNTRPESLDVEIQALRLGDVFLAAHPCELFTTLDLDLRRSWPHDDLFVLGYSNGSIGYVADAYDIEGRTYAGYTSAKNSGQFPFTNDSGPALVQGMLEALGETLVTTTEQ